MRDDDDALLDALAAAWAERDPVPEDLVEHLRAVVAAACAAQEVEAVGIDDLDYELLALVSTWDAQALGLRAAGEDTLVVIELTGREVQVLLRLGDGRLDGWVGPPASGTVTLVPAGATDHDGGAASAGVGDEGRFVVVPAPTGAFVLRFVLDDGRRYQTPVVTL